MWNLTRWRATSLPFTFLNIGKFLCQSSLGILFGKPRMWSRLMGAYLLATVFILENLKLLIFMQWIHHEVLIWILQPVESLINLKCVQSLGEEFSLHMHLIVVHHHQLGLNFVVLPKEYIIFRFPQWSRQNVITQIEPHAERGNSEVTSNHA